MCEQISVDAAMVALLDAVIDEWPGVTVMQWDAGRMTELFELRNEIAGVVGIPERATSNPVWVHPQPDGKS